jgi:hypothetical protein
MSKKKVHIAVEDMAHDLGVLEGDIESWIGSENVVTSTDHRDRITVDEIKKSEFANSDKYVDCLKRSMASDLSGWQESKFFAEKTKIIRLSRIEKYQTYLSELKEFHCSIRLAVNFHEHESPVKAAYLLMSKAISCLMMGCENLSKGYWFSGSIIREIDEALDLARYFIVLAETETGKKNLRKWFRQNYAPKHSDCRHALSEHTASLVCEVEKESQRLLMNEIYQKKSKWVHPTFGVIREVTEFETSDDLDILECSLGTTKHQIKLLELTDFYKSSIWSAFQTFILCFSQALPLDSEKIERLINIDKEFQIWS